MDDLVIVSERLGALTETEATIEAVGARVRSAPLWTAEQIAGNASDASVVILGAVERFGAEELAALPHCHGVVRRGVGYDNVDVDAATRLGIVVANVPDASVEEVSDHALALLLTVERRICELDSAVRMGEWEHDPAAIQSLRGGIRRIGELTLGVVGLGRIGRALVRKAGALYRRVVAADPLVSPADADRLGAELVALPDLLTSADHVSLHVPMSPGNRQLIGASELATMRPGAVLVNTARGGLVDEVALLAAIREGSVSGAGLDATEREPLPKNDPMLRSGRIVLTAHSGAWSRTSQADLATRSVESAIRLIQGRAPDSVVNPAVLESPELRNVGLRERHSSTLTTTSRRNA